jgi:hypothetical protein
MPNIAWIDVEVHKTNLSEAIERGIQSQAKKIAFSGLDVELVKKAFEAGREVLILQTGAPMPDGAVDVPFFQGTQQSRAFVHARNSIASSHKKE